MLLAAAVIAKGINCASEHPSICASVCGGVKVKAKLIASLLKQKEYRREIAGIRKELNRRAYDFYTLFEISKELNGVLDPDKIIKIILYKCRAHLKVMDITLMVLMLPESFPEDGENTRFLPVKLESGKRIRKIQDYNIGINNPLAAALREKKRILKKEEIRRYDRKNVFELCVPLFVKDELRGIMFVGKRKLKAEEFSSADIDFLSILGSFTSLSLENARLYTLAITDGLTHLYTHRYFQMRLNDEFRRAIRYKREFSLIIFDVDFFKKVNDQYGHAAGDDVLIGITKILNKSLRNSDIASRHGGDEFSLILPETIKERAVEVAERIRKSVEKMEFRHGGKKIKVTISMGVSAVKPSYNDKKQLYKKADACLYKAKESGRNRVVV